MFGILRRGARRLRSTLASLKAGHYKVVLADYWPLLTVSSYRSVSVCECVCLPQYPAYKLISEPDV